MPKFGDYETIDEPIRVTEAARHVSTIWKVRHTVAQDGLVYIVKQFTPRGAEDFAGNLLDPDASAEDDLRAFLEGVQQLKDAKEADGPGKRYLAPIHAVGNADNGAWYATDYYPRRTLKEFINLQGGVETRALERVIYRIVMGCLALQQATGRSHGNLKASNILLAGKPQHLRKTPFHLIDPLPVRPAPILGQRAGPDAKEAELARARTEAADLRSIGELILQLVEGRIISSAYDYNYPVASAPAWDVLGKDAGLWRQRCNQLLNPQLKLNQVNLQSLEAEFRPGRFDSTLPRVLVGGMGVAAVAAAVWWTMDQEPRKSGPRAEERAQQSSREDWRRLVAASEEAGRRGDWRTARDMLGQALRKTQELNDPALRQQTESSLGFAQGMSDVLDSLRDRKIDAARQSVQKIAQMRPNDPAVASLRAQVDAAVDEVSKEKEFQQLMLAAQRAETDEQWPRAVESLKQALLRASTLKDTHYRAAAADELNYAQKMQTAQAFLDDKAHPDFFSAIAHARDALALKPSSTNAAMRLIDRAQRLRQALLQSPAETVRVTPPPRRVEVPATETTGPSAPDPTRLRLEESYQNAWKAAQAALQRADYNEVIRQADQALAAKNNDPRAANLKLQAQAGLRLQASLTAAQTALSQGKYAEAIQNADAVLTLRKDDPQAARIKADAESGRAFEAALQAAETAFDQGEYSEAIRQADLALSYRGKDPKAIRLKSEAQARAGYFAAMKAAESAFTRGDYAEAVKLADAALTARARDPQASKLKADAQAEQSFQSSLAAAQAAYERGDYPQTIQHAQAAQQLKKNNRAAADLIDKSRVQLAKNENEREQQAKYVTSVGTARAALERRDYAQAISQADVALTLRPNDPEAGKLKTDAQVEQSFQLSMTAAQAAFDRGEYLQSIEHAQAAQQAKKNDRMAADLIEKSRGLIAKNQTEKEQQAKYLASVGTARAAVERRDYAQVIAQADAALTLRPKDPEATKLKNWGLQQQTYQLASVAFKEGDYAKALGHCQQYQGVDPFDRLSREISQEQNQLKSVQAAFAQGSYADLLAASLPNKPAFERIKAAAQEENLALQQLTQKLAGGDYAYIEALERQAYKTKPPFSALLENGRAERQTLQRLQSLKAPSQRPILVAELGKLPQTIRAKPPFAALEPGPQTSPEAAATIARNDRLLDHWEILFGLKPRPSGSETKPERDPTRDAAYKLKEVDKLEADYAAVGGLDAERRQRLNAIRWRVSGGTRGEPPGAAR